MENVSRNDSKHDYERWLALLIVIFAALGMPACGGVSGSSNSGPTPKPASNPKVVIVVEENKAYSEVIGNSAMPYLNSLATQYAVAASYYADTHPSLPNYFMLTTGQTVVENTDTYTGVFNGDNVVRSLNAAGKTWKVYAESLPSVGYIGGDQYPYIQHHNTMSYLSDVVNSAAQQQNVVPVTQLAADLAVGNLPDYSFVVPDDQNNSHDCPANMPACSINENLANADTWLRNIIGPVVNDANFQNNGLLIITYDESGSNDRAHGGGHVATVVVGSKVKRGFQSTTLYQHESMLRFMLKYLGITQYPGAAATAPDMDEFLR